MLTNTDKETDMQINRTMNRSDLAERMSSCELPDAEVEAMVSLLVAEFDGMDTKDVPERRWGELLESAAQKSKMTATDWAIDHGYHEIETDTSDEFVAWQSMDNEDENGAPVTAFCGVKAWRDYAFDERFVAVLRWENGETYGQHGYGRTMLEALQDL